MAGKRTGRIIKITGNMVMAETEGFVIQNEVAYIVHGEERLKAEVIRVRGNCAEMQVFEYTRGIRVGDEVEFTDELLSVELGPGLLGQIFDGLQNPLPHLAKEHGFFLKRGVYLEPLDPKKEWAFTPMAKEGEAVRAGDRLGFVQEMIFKHYTLVPFGLKGRAEVVKIAKTSKYNVKQPIAELKDADGKRHEVYLSQAWPVKIPIRAYAEKLRPETPLVTKMRLIDSLFPVAAGGTYCIPGPFGAGKTVLQQLTSRHAEADIVITIDRPERRNALNRLAVEGLTQAFETLQAFVRSQHWVRTDAWRGYVETEAPEAWQRVLNTWSPTVRDSGYRGKMDALIKKML